MKTPIYQVVKETLREKIDSGVLTTGEKIESEEELADRFGCSRLTVHRALRELADEGLVVRRRRAGTQVARRDTGGVMIRVPKISEEVEALGLRYRYELLSRDVAVPRAAVSALLRVPEGEPMMHVVSRHWAGDRVFQHEDRWINIVIAADAVDQTFAETSANDWLQDNVPFNCVDHEITAHVATLAQAGTLLIGPGDAILQVRRLTHLATRRVTYAVLTHPGDLFSLRSETRGYSLNSS